MRAICVVVLLLAATLPALSLKTAKETSRSAAQNVYDGLDDFTDKMKDTARHAYDAVRYGAGERASEKWDDTKAGTRDAVLGASRSFRDKAADAGDYLKDKIQHTLGIDSHEPISDRVEDAGGKVKSWMNKLGYKAGDAAEDAKYAARDSGRDIKHKVKRHVAFGSDDSDHDESFGDRVKHAFGFGEEEKPSLAQRAYRRVRDMTRDEVEEESFMDRVKGWFGWGEEPKERTWSEKLRDKLPFGHEEEDEEESHESWGHRIKRGFGLVEEEEEEPSWMDRFKQAIWMAREKGESEESIYDRLKHRLGWGEEEEPTWRDRISHIFRSAADSNFADRVRDSVKDKTSFLRGRDAAKYAKNAKEYAQDMGSNIRDKLRSATESYEPSFWQRFLHVFGLYSHPSELREQADDLRSRARELEEEASERDPSWFGGVGHSARKVYDRVVGEKGADMAKEAYNSAKDSVKGGVRRVKRSLDDLASRSRNDYDLNISRLFRSDRSLTMDVLRRNAVLIFSLGIITLAFLAAWLGAKNNWKFDQRYFRGQRLFVTIACSMAIGLGASLLLLSTSKMALDGILETPWKHASGDMRREVQDRFDCCGYSSLVDHVAMPCMHASNCRDMIWRGATRWFRPLGALLILLGAFGLIGGRAGLQRLNLPISHLRRQAHDVKESLGQAISELKSKTAPAVREIERSSDDSSGPVNRVGLKDTHTTGEGHIRQRETTRTRERVETTAQTVQ